MSPNRVADGTGRRGRLAAVLIAGLFAAGPGAETRAAEAALPGGIQGATEPYRFATISSEIAGRITAVRINEGGRARKGDTILVLDPEEAMLDAERNRLLAESEAELAAARLKADVAQKDFLATRTLFDSTRSVSQEEYRKKELEYGLAKTEVERLALAKQKSGLEYRMALVNLKRHYVLAPYDGIVAQRFLNEGETCKPQEPLIKFVDVTRCRLIAYVPAGRAQKLAKGAAVVLALSDGRGGTKVRNGVIDFLSPVVDQASGLRTTKVVFDNADGSIQPGIVGYLRMEN